jgi:hypothetical protein
MGGRNDSEEKRRSMIKALENPCGVMYEKVRALEMYLYHERRFFGEIVCAYLLYFRDE